MARKQFDIRPRRRPNAKRQSWQPANYTQSRSSTKQRRLLKPTTPTSFAAVPGQPKSKVFSSRTILIAIAVLSLGYLLTRRAETIEVDFKTKLDKDIKVATNDYLDTHSRYIWLINESKLEESLSEDFSSLKGTEVKIAPLSETITITATHRIPTAIWQTGGIQYLVDADGVIMGQVENNPKLPLVIDTLDVPVRLGAQVTTTDFVAFLAAVDTEAKTAKVAVKNYLISASPRELKINLASPELEVIFDTSRPATTQVSDLVNILAQRGEGKLQINSYIDLRNSRKAYYK